jgi:nitrite reductase/ring-hydroxylating ferredoxin subunit
MPTYTKKKKLFTPRSLVIVGLLLGGLALYLIRSYNTGTGPFSSFSSTADINRIVVEDENFAKNAAEKKAIQQLNQAANAEARAKTPAQKKKAEDELNAAANQYAQAQAATIAKEKADKAKTDKQNACTQCQQHAPAGACTDICSGAPAPVVVNPNSLAPAGGGQPPAGGGTPSTDKKICNTGSAGVNVEAGKWVATGYGLDKDGNRCTSSGCSQRECVQITDSCGHSKPKPCDVQYKTDPTSVVLPPSAGTEYTAGLTPAEIAKAEADAKAKGEAPPAKVLPKNQCYDKSTSGQWVIVTDGTPKSGSPDEVCGDGKFVKKTAYDAAKKAECEADGLHTWNGTACVAKKLVPTDAEKKTKADECRAQNKAYDATKNDCGAVMKCGPGYKLNANDGFCDLNPGSGSENVRQGIIDSGTAFCAKLQGKKFDINTGLCIGTGETPVVRPWKCDPGVTYTSGTKQGHRFCELDSTGKVIGEKYIFCDSATSTYDSQTGKCNLKTALPPAGTQKLEKVGKECPKDYLSCSGFCDKNSEGRFASKVVDGKIVCDVPPAVTTPVKETPPVQGPSNTVTRSEYTQQLSDTFDLVKRAGGDIETFRTCPPASTCFPYGAGRGTVFVRVSDVVNSAKKIEDDVNYLHLYDEIIAKDKNAFDEGPHDFGQYTTKAECESKKLDCIKVTNGLFYTYVEKKVLDDLAAELKVKEMTIPPIEPPKQAAAPVTTTPVVTPVTIITNPYQTLKKGDNCGSLGYPSCDKCEGGVKTQYTEAGSPVSFNKCGTEAEVKKILDADKVPAAEQKIIGDDSDKQTLSVGDACKDGALSSIKCSQCPGGASSYVTVGGKSAKICGTEAQLAGVDLTNYSGSLNPPNTVGANAAVGGGAGCAAGATLGAVYGAAAGLGVFSAPVAIVGGVVGCVVGAVSGAGVAAAATPTGGTPANVLNLKKSGESCGHKVAGFIIVKDSNGDESCSDGVCEYMPGIADNGVDVRHSGYYCK